MSAHTQEKTVGHQTCKLPLALPSYTVANAPLATSYGAGHIIYVSNGAAGTPILAFSNGTDWLRSDTFAAIAAV